MNKTEQCTMTSEELLNKLSTNFIKFICTKGEFDEERIVNVYPFNKLHKSTFSEKTIWVATKVRPIYEKYEGDPKKVVNALLPLFGASGVEKEIYEKMEELSHDEMFVQKVVRFIQALVDVCTNQTN
jgi:hypothetical protein